MSMRRATFDLLQAEAEREGTSMSGLMDLLIRGHVGAPPRVDPRQLRLPFAPYARVEPAAPPAAPAKPVRTSPPATLKARPRPKPGIGGVHEF